MRHCAQDETLILSPKSMDVTQVHTLYHYFKWGRNATANSVFVSQRYLEMQLERVINGGSNSGKDGTATADVKRISLHR